MQKTIKLGSVEITVQTAQTIRDELNAALISKKVMSLEPEGANGYYDLFGELCAHTVDAKGLAFDPTALADGPAVDAHAAYDCFMGMHKKLKKLWTVSMTEVDAAYSDPVTGPVPPSGDADPNL